MSVIKLYTIMMMGASILWRIMVMSMGNDVDRCCHLVGNDGDVIGAATL